jgi:hypothetical protein
MNVEYRSGNVHLKDQRRHEPEGDSVDQKWIGLSRVRADDRRP